MREIVTEIIKQLKGAGVVFPEKHSCDITINVYGHFKDTVDVLDQLVYAISDGGEKHKIDAIAAAYRLRRQLDK